MAARERAELLRLQLEHNGSQCFELECGEDIDTVERNKENGAEKRLLEQLKLRSGRGIPKSWRYWRVGRAPY